ncbi:MAG TPA: right-handed parallel beta-helix repeat-containing protein [Methylomirabilota bacterium]|nr:right-handed parallel beta-helix repeat-containing protein [Methylomirabilota bacterium]
MKTKIQTTLGGLALLSALTLPLQPATVRAQGSLTPPGPPAPTMKTLAQVEPRTPISSLPHTINRPGSYYLTTNLVGNATNGITVAASDVTLDLGGFVLDGNGAAFSGIAVPNAQTNLVIRNGIVKRWNGAAGVEALASFNVSVERLQASSNGGDGIRAGFGSRVSDCTASGNGGRGFYLNANSALIHSVARLNGAEGIVTDNGCVVQGCTAAGNQSYGIRVAAGCTVSDSAAQANQTDGINAAGAMTAIFHCTSSQNASNGISLGAQSEIGSCVMSHNGGRGLYVRDGFVGVKECAANANKGPAGIEVGDGAVIIGCLASWNGTTNTAAAGIVAGGSCTIKDCAANFNSGHGISAGNGCTIAGNTARANKLDGIRFGSSCGVTGNTCDYNGYGGDGAGLHATGQAARIEANHVIANDRGIDVDGDRNVIIRNTCGFNTTDYDIVANNKVGVIVAVPNSGAIAGSTGGAGLGTTDPWANVSY